MDAIKLVKFENLNLDDIFFDSLKKDYVGFEGWFNKKKLSKEVAYVLEENGIQGFLYLKREEEEHFDIEPILEEKLRIKVGTFKINAHGTKLGERFIKIIIDYMYEERIEEAYVTVFEKHDELIKLLKKYGFEYHGVKKSISGVEQVYMKKFLVEKKDIYLDYPKINTDGNNKFLLSIYPKYHTKIFPDSRLKTEGNHIIEDIPCTNSIKKIYLSGSGDLVNYKKGDIVVIYRTKEYNKSARYSSVATSICTIESIRSIYEFANYNEFYSYCNKYSVFSNDELSNFWMHKTYPHIIKMLYNIAMDKKIIRKRLIDEIGLDGNTRWVVVPLTNKQFNKILEIGEVDESLIIN